MEKFVIDRIREIGKDLSILGNTLISTRVLKNAFSLFDSTWEMLFPKEQIRIIQLLLEKVEYHGAQENVEITFSQAGLKTLAEEVETAIKKEEVHESKNR